MEINLEKINLRKLLLPFLLLLTVGAAFVLRDTWMPLITSLFEDVPEASEAAEQGVSAFYTIDHSKGIGAWVDQYCEVATDEGCRAFADVYAPAFWPVIEQNKITTGCKTNAVAVVDEFIGGNKTPFITQIWLVDAKLTQPFDATSEGQMEVYAVLKRPEGGKEWIFERILFENETEQYQTQDQEG
jgi:hypothetical protein